MRTIKFRGKPTVIVKDWVYGGYKKENIIWNEDLLVPMDNLVDPETVGQFTGLYDKNGTEIYENDILQLKRDGKEYNPLLVVYSEVYAGFCMLSEDVLNNVIYKPHRPVNPNWWDEFKDEIEIIGNIYDNPELFKQ